MLEVMR